MQPSCCWWQTKFVLRIIKRLFWLGTCHGKNESKKTRQGSVEEFIADEDDPKQLILNAANEGCLLHRLYIDANITDEQFNSGLAFAKLYSLSMRSLGIHNRVRTASQSWDQLQGIVYDKFSSRQIEGIWRYILKALDPIYHNDIPMRQIAFHLVMTQQSTPIHSIEDIRKTLSYLNEVWEKIESSPYRLGLYESNTKPIYIRLQ